MRRAAIARGGRVQHGQLNAFASLDSLIAAVTGGKSQRLLSRRPASPRTRSATATNSGRAAPSPRRAQQAQAAPGGTATTGATTGAWGYANPTNANTGHFLVGECTASVINNTLLIIDQLLRVAKTMNSTATEAVTGTFSRYQKRHRDCSRLHRRQLLLPGQPDHGAGGHGAQLDGVPVHEPSQCDREEFTERHRRLGPT